MEQEKTDLIENEGGPQQIVFTRGDPLPPLYVFVLLFSLLMNGFMASAWWSTQEGVRRQTEQNDDLLAYVITLRESLIKAGFQPPPLENNDETRSTDP